MSTTVAGTADGTSPIPDRGEAAPRADSRTAKAAKLGAARRAAVRAEKAKDPRRDASFWSKEEPGRKEALLKRIKWERKLLAHRFDGRLNIFPHLVSKIRFGGVQNSGSEQKLTRREFAELKLKEAETFLASKADGLDDKDMRHALRLIERAHTRGIRKFDTFLDDFTENIFSNVVSLFVSGILERKNQKLDAQGGKRLDAKGNFWGQVKTFLAKYIPYLGGVYASRGRNCLHEVNPDTSLKFNGTFAWAEILAAGIMVGGSGLGAYALEHGVKVGREKAHVLSGVVSGVVAGYFCYWFINRGNPLAANSSPTRGAIRAGINVPIRMSMGPLLAKLFGWKSPGASAAH